MPDRSPGYDLDDELHLDDAAQYRALFEPTRMEIVRLVGQRAATVSQLAEALDRPKGTIGHHVDALADAGLVRVVRTERVRAIEAKYWGRTARTFVYGGFDGAGIAVPSPVATAAEEYAAAGTVGMASLRHAQVPEGRAREWTERLAALAAEFASEPAGGTTTYGLVLALYETERPTFPADADEVGR
jgi:DNA-binding transcriptional ArsR family regulator